LNIKDLPVVAKIEGYRAENDLERAHAAAPRGLNRAPDPARSALPAGTPLRVLIVDDSEDDARFIVRALKRGGYAPEYERVDTAEAMKSALDRGAWDVILSDFDMPDFDMPSALALRNERRPEAPFIIISGRIGEDAIVTAMKSGAQEYVLKSDLGRLIPALERSLREMATLAESKRAEAALRESEERYALAVRGSRDGLWDWNALTGEVYYAPRFKEMLGFDEHELSDVASFIELVHPDDSEALRLALQAHLEARQPFSAEFRARTKQGELRWFSCRGQALWDSAGKPTRMAGSLTDLTDRRRVEDELRRNLDLVQEQLEVIQRQQEEIQVLRTPIIQVWDGVLMTPVLGVLDRDRATALMELLLGAVVKTRSRHVILDLTAVEAIDVATANHVVRLVRAVELLGARGIVVGVQPRVAATLATAGLDLSHVKTLADLREALLFCMQRRSGRHGELSQPARPARPGQPARPVHR
jgi:anti-anti-sigma factor